MTQRYGCTGFGWNPRRGSCAHFHDGLDISPSGGTRIGAAATGVIAYAGWNPWDSEGRAFIVVMGHADGYVTRYGHLVPNRRVAYSGKFVYRGQTIGYMGSTGNSTGVHLHVEVLRGNSTVDPMSLFPDRGDDGKKAKEKKKDKAKDKKRRSAKAKRKGDGKRERGNASANPKRDSDRKTDRAPDEASAEVDPTPGDAVESDPHSERASRRPTPLARRT